MPSSGLTIEYDSSDSEEDLPAPTSSRRRLPTLSSALTVPTPIDDPSLHQGRVRNTPYVEGQWAAYAYVPVSISKDSQLHAILSRIWTASKDHSPSLHSTVHLMEDSHADGGTTGKARDVELHISLSRPLYLRVHQRNELKAVVRNIAQKHDPFPASFATVSNLVNDDRTRAFLALEAGAGHAHFKSLSDGLDDILKTLRQESYYSQPRFHASFAWKLLNQAPVPGPGYDDNGDVSMVASESLEVFPANLLDGLRQLCDRLHLPKHSSFEADRICVRIGKEVTEYILHQSI